ncbi:MAG: hypothetical protein ACLGHA_05695 [Gammaproteobacteria bacterium]
MMNEQKTWVRFVAECTIVGRNFVEGDVAQFSPETARQLFRDARAVPHAGPGRMLTSDSHGTARSARRAA